GRPADRIDRKDHQHPDERLAVPAGGRQLRHPADRRSGDHLGADAARRHQEGAVMREGRSAGFYWLAALFALFVLFLYGPMITIFVLSFQGPNGGLTFPTNGFSFHWFARLWEGLGVVDIWAAFRRSLRLGLVVMVLTVTFSLLAGLAYRKRFLGSNLLFYVVVASLIVPSIVVSLGIGLEFRLLDDLVKWAAES